MQLRSAFLSNVCVGAIAASKQWSLQRMVIEGDSITSITPSLYESGKFSYRYDDLRPDLFVEVRAEANRAVGWAGDGRTNTLRDHVDEDVTYNPDLISYKIGANDLAAARTHTQHRGDLTARYAQYKAAKPDVRIAWSPPLPWRTPGAVHGSYTAFMTQRAGLIADCRDPAVWGQWADYFVPMGLHPDFLEASLQDTLFGPPPEDVHPVNAGHDRLLAVFKEAINTIGDPARASSTVPYSTVWPASETNLTLSTEIVRRFVVSGINPKGLDLGVSVSGGGAQIRINGGPWLTTAGTNSGNGYRIYNGDVIDMKLTTSSSSDTPVDVNLTIGSEMRTISYRTVMVVTPASLTSTGFVTRDAPAGTTFTNNITFDAGDAILVINGVAPTSITIGGVAATLINTIEQSAGSSHALRMYRLVGVTAGSKTVTVTYAAAQSKIVMFYGTVQGADPTLVATPTRYVANENDPHTLPSVMVPAAGLYLAVMYSTGLNSAPTVTSNNASVPMLVPGQASAIYQSDARSFGVAAGTVPGAQVASFNSTFGSFIRFGAVFKALGT